MSGYRRAYGPPEPPDGPVGVLPMAGEVAGDVPRGPMGAGDGWRDYTREYNRVYQVEEGPPPPPPQPSSPNPPTLVPVVWGGMDIDPGWVNEAFTAVVENVTGWYGSPPLVGRDTERALADGGAWGYKTIGPRDIEITGAAAGPRPQLMDWRDRLVGLAAAREPAELAITDPWLNVTHTAMVRAGTDNFRHEFIADGYAFRWQVTLTAADPLVYDQQWQTLTLNTTTAADAGREYPRDYSMNEPAYSGWEYADPHPPGSAGYLRNDGDAPAPVYALYQGDLSSSRLTENGKSILVQALQSGVSIMVPSATLAAEAPGGAPRQAYVLPGSRPMFIPPFATVRWHLYAQGSGTVQLNWRSAWW